MRPSTGQTRGSSRGRAEKHLIAFLEGLAGVSPWLLFWLWFWYGWQLHWTLLGYLYFAGLVLALLWYRDLRREQPDAPAARRRWWSRALLTVAAGAVVVTLPAVDGRDGELPLWVHGAAAPLFALVASLYVRTPPGARGAARAARAAAGTAAGVLVLFVVFGAPLWWSLGLAAPALAARVALRPYAELEAAAARATRVWWALALLNALAVVWVAACAMWLWEHSTERVEGDEYIGPTGLPAWGYGTAGAAIAAAIAARAVQRRLTSPSR